VEKKYPTPANGAMGSPYGDVEMYCAGASEANVSTFKPPKYALLQPSLIPRTERVIEVGLPDVLVHELSLYF
jgi:hypothetical protein